MKDFAKDHVFAIQGQTKIDSLYVVQKGSFALFDEKNGNKKLAGFIKSGEVFGGITILIGLFLTLSTRRKALGQKTSASRTAEA